MPAILLLCSWRSCNTVRSGPHSLPQTANLTSGLSLPLWCFQLKNRCRRYVKVHEMAAWTNETSPGRPSNIHFLMEAESVPLRCAQLITHRQWAAAGDRRGDRRAIFSADLWHTWLEQPKGCEKHLRDRGRRRHGACDQHNLARSHLSKTNLALSLIAFELTSRESRSCTIWGYDRQMRRARFSLAQ